MNKTIAIVNYKARHATEGGSGISITDAEVPASVNRMIAWCLLHPAQAEALLPAFQQIADAAAAVLSEP